ncbi:MAG: type II toxin-antitoxin system RelE/ParE family toxin [Candidatus Hydrogenedentes bacterium]|nr:type II toxin-antitoxin system RelE/ParE family toxin [Candidatus Hydrogenedentota bacterium]
MIQNRRLVYYPDVIKTIERFPADTCEVIYHALEEARLGGKHLQVKPLAGFKGASTLEIRDSSGGRAFRVVYTTELKDKIVVLLAFEKKSKSGISTPRHQIDLVHKRLKEARSRFGDK